MRRTYRLHTLENRIVIEGTEYVVQGTADPFDESKRRIYRAWIRASAIAQHATIMSFGHGWYGLMGTELDTPTGECSAQARSVIRAAFPDLVRQRIRFLEDYEIAG